MFWPQVCPVCREDLPERGNRRVYVPWKRGFRLVHAGACFEAIDAQGVLDLERKAPPVDPVLLVRMRRLSQLLRREDEGRELAREPREGVRTLIVRLARLDQPLVGGPLGDRGERPLLRGDELRDYMLQLAHACEVSAPTRTEVHAW